MSEHEPAENDEVHVVDDDPAEERRKDELEAAIAEKGEPAPEEEHYEEAAPGSAQTMIAEARKHIGYPESGENATRCNRFGPTPKVGDFVYYGPGGKTHVELVAGVGPKTIRTIGGNTDGSLAGNYFNGNGVYEKTVSRSSSSIHGYGRPVYGSAGGGGGG